MEWAHSLPYLLHAPPVALLNSDFRQADASAVVHNENFDNWVAARVATFFGCYKRCPGPVYCLIVVDKHYRTDSYPDKKVAPVHCTQMPLLVFARTAPLAFAVVILSRAAAHSPVLDTIVWGYKLLAVKLVLCRAVGSLLGILTGCHTGGYPCFG